jgi:molecular chaperone IbpA
MAALAPLGTLLREAAAEAYSRLDRAAGTSLRDLMAAAEVYEMRGANLAGADLRGQDLSGVDFEGADLRGADLSGCNLAGANLTGADITGANFTGAVLNDPKLIERVEAQEAVVVQRARSFGSSPERGTGGAFGRLFDYLGNVGRRAERNESPPYDIEKLSEDKYRLTLNVGGYEAGELDVTVRANLLIVSGERRRKLREVDLAPPRFVLEFELADYVKVFSAELGQGFLVIELLRPVPDVRLEKIAIGTTDGAPEDVAAAAQSEKPA